MNKTPKIIVAVGILLISKVAYSEQITDTYNTGDTLTATTMDTIKSAVNSKQDRVSGVCSPGSSIGAVNADGSVSCETDDDSGGDITEVIAGDGLSGGGTTGSITLTLSGSVSVSSRSFHEWASLCEGNHFTNIPLAYYGSPNPNCLFYAGIQFPDGVSVTDMNCTVGTLGVFARLERINLLTGVVDYIFETPPTPGVGFLQVVVDTTPINSIIDNSLYAYSLVITTVGSNSRIYGCSISY